MPLCCDLVAPRGCTRRWPNGPPARHVSRRVHDAVAVRDYVEKMSDRRIAQTRNMVRRRLGKSALHHHAGAASGAVVAFGTHGIEAFATPGQQLRCQLYRKLRNISSIR